MVKNHTLLNVSLETEDANSQAKHNESRKAYLYLKKNSTLNRTHPLWFGNNYRRLSLSWTGGTLQ